MTKVYAINSYGNPIESASKFGEVVEITTGPINPFSIDRLAWSIAPALNQFTPEDYLLLTGPGSGYILATIMLLGRGIDKIKCLRYETSTRQYEEAIVDYYSVAQALPPVAESTDHGRIYVINYSGHSIEPSLRFSNFPKEDKLRIITHGNINQSDIPAMIKRVSHAMQHFGMGDMLLLSGPAILHVICATALFVNKEPFSVLIYNPKYREYIKREVDIRHLMEVCILAANEKIIA